MPVKNEAEGRLETGKKPKPLLSARHAVNWYLGNYLLAPHNALRGGEEWTLWIYAMMDALEKELGSRKMTHKEFLELVKERGIHSKYYLYRILSLPQGRAAGLPVLPAPGKEILIAGRALGLERVKAEN